MSRPGPRRAARRAALGLGVLGVMAGLLPIQAAAAADRLPDLRSARTTDFRISTTSSGRRILRFTSQMLNYGAGPLEIRGSRSSRNAAFDIDQVIYTTTGSRRIDSPATVAYAGDGHDHYHVRRVMSYHLWSTNGTFKDQKIGFCFFDTTPKQLSLPRAPRSRVYRESTCGTRSSLSIRAGLSVGWGDTYPWNFAYQWIDITGMPAGTYTVRSVVDLYDAFLESSETNNCAYSRIRFGSSGSSVTVLGSGSTCVNDYTGTPYNAAVRWALQNSIASTCAPGLFCTYNAASREDMAAYMSRVLELPATETDYFDDDDGRALEPHIDRVAEAALLGQCGARQFCPTRALRRSEVATMIARGLGLEPSTANHFTDDDGTAAEPWIDAVVDAGLMTGCSSTRFCPVGRVTRGEAVDVVFRAFPPG